METITYYSKNNKLPPFVVTIKISRPLVYINCDCELGLDKKICRHKINAIRGDKGKSHSSTSDDVIARLKSLFGSTSTARQHLEEKWRLLREFADDNPENEQEISEKRRILGEAFANGFCNENTAITRTPFDTDHWEESREIYAADLKCPATLKYVDQEGTATIRDVIIKEIFISDRKFYLLGYCNLRKQNRTFRVDRIQGVSFGHECTQNDKNIILDVVFQGNPAQLPQSDDSAIFNP